MPTDLTTTNVFLGIMAAVSVLEVLAVLAVVIGGVIVYRRVLEALRGFEERQVAPAAARVNAILDDVKGVTSTVKTKTGHLERLVDWIVDAVARRNRRPVGQPSDRVM